MGQVELERGDSSEFFGRAWPESESPHSLGSIDIQLSQRREHAR